MLKPKLFTTLQGYTKEQFRQDFLAGIIVGVIALPLSIAFAIASGVGPDKGIITAIVAGFLISFLGGSRVQVGGPTGAFVVIVYGIVAKFGVDGLVTATFLAGLILLAMGFLRCGMIIQFIPYSVVIGFTTGIAVTIFSTQIKDLLGLTIDKVPAEFFEKWGVYLSNMHTINIAAAMLALITILILLAGPKIFKKVPPAVVALIVTTVLVKWMNLPVETIGSRFGEMPKGLPLPQIPHIDWMLIRELFPSAVTIALLAAIESLLSAVVSDGMIGGRHRSNMELIAQGAGNIGSSLFGGIPATGAIARTAANVHNGGRTPVAGIVHAFALLVMMLMLGNLVTAIPLAALAGILVVVAYRMAEFHSFSMVLRGSKSDILVLLATFILTVVIDLTAAVQIGMVMASFLLIYRLSQESKVEVFTSEFVDEEERDETNPINKKDIPQGVEVYEIRGSLFFGAVSSFLETMRSLKVKPKVRIIRMRHVIDVDASGINALHKVLKDSKKSGVAVIFSGVSERLYHSFEKTDIIDAVGKANICSNIDEALVRAMDLVIIKNFSGK